MQSPVLSTVPQNLVSVVLRPSGRLDGRFAVQHAAITAGPPSSREAQGMHGVPGAVHAASSRRVPGPVSGSPS